MNIVVSMAFGLILMPTMSLTERIVQGFIIGVSASGVYDTCKSFKKEKDGGIENGK